MAWKKLNRTTIYDTPFLKVYEDRVKLPNGNFHEKYSVVQFPDVVIIVATDKNNNVLTLNEYKYGPDRICRVFPAGHMKRDEDPIDAARRELLEETGYGEGSFELIGNLWEFPTKMLGKAYLVQAKNVEKIAGQSLDENEELSVQTVKVDDLRKEIEDKQWIDAKALAAITLTGILTS